MKKRKFLSIFLAVFLSLSILPIGALSDMQTDSPYRPVLQGVQREIQSADDFTETHLKSELTAPDTLLNTQSKQFLNEYHFDCSMPVTVEVVEDAPTHRIIRRAELPEAQVEFDLNGQLIHFINYEAMPSLRPSADGAEAANYARVSEKNYSLKTQTDLSFIISELEESLQLDGYTLVDCNDDLTGIWSLLWQKQCENGILNPYDAVSVAIDASNGELCSLARNTDLPNTTGSPVITEEDALRIAQPIRDTFPDITQTTIELAYFRPNFYWESEGTPFVEADFIRMAWKISLDTCATIYVDALTGEILGGNTTLASDVGRAMSVAPDAVGAEQCANMASAALLRLGYQQPYGYQPHTGWVQHGDVKWMFENCRGAFLLCHGGEWFPNSHVGVLTDKRYDYNWMFAAGEVDREYHFLFLDACSQGNENLAYSWCNAFHIGGNGSNTAFVSWNNDVDETVAYTFCCRFLPRLGNGSVHSLVVDISTTMRAQGYDCNPAYHGDLNYWGWAW